MRIPAALRPFLAYAASIALGKGLTLVTLPLLAHHLAPPEFVRLDMAASILEPLGLLAAFALADSLFRFAQEPEKRSAALGRFLGMALVLSALLIAVTQGLLVPLLSGAPNMPGETAFRAILLAACLGGLIELPLAFLRLEGRPGRFLAFVAARALAQAGLLAALVTNGFGVDAILLGNAGIDLAIIAGLMASLPRGTRIVFDRVLMRQGFGYAVPLLLGALAMFVLGACDRWFLAGRVPAESLAHYALAAKLALALALATQPFALWWYPRRLGILASPDGAAKTARFWTFGVLAIGVSGLLVMIAARILVTALLPAGYHGALAYLAPMIGLVALNELASLSNGAAYARDRGWQVLRINGAGAAGTLALYAALIPGFGLTGAMIATLAGQALRVALFLADRHDGARLPFPVVPAACFLGGVFLLMLQLAQPGWPSPAAMLPLAILGLFAGMASLAAPGRLLPSRHGGGI